VPSSGMWRRVVGLVRTDVPEENVTPPPPPNFRVERAAALRSRILSILKIEATHSSKRRLSQDLHSATP
jgi:hypothetical protein